MWTYANVSLSANAHAFDSVLKASNHTPLPNLK
jgi:hypothetical protein